MKSKNKVMGARMKAGYGASEEEQPSVQLKLLAKHK